MDREIDRYYYYGVKSCILYKDEYGNVEMEEDNNE